YQLLVFLGQLVHTQDRDDVLQLLVALQNVLNATGNFVVLLTDDQRIQRTAGGVQRVYRRVDTQGSDVTAQYHSRVKVSKGGGRRRAVHACRRSVSCARGRHGAALGGGGALPEFTGPLTQRRLSSQCGRACSKCAGIKGTSVGLWANVHAK